MINQMGGTMKRVIFWASLLVIASQAFAVHAEIVKTARLDDSRCKGICLYWWPKVIVPEGWQQDEAFSWQNNINFLYKVDGPSDLGIYAGAISTEGQALTLTDFMANDRKTFVKDHNMSVEDGPVFVTQDGQSLQSLVLEPSGKEHWDITAYGEEADSDGNHYYLTFTLGAPSREARDLNLPVLKQIIAAYHK
jgi:hypothetical protein